MRASPNPSPLPPEKKSARPPAKEVEQSNNTTLIYPAQLVESKGEDLFIFKLWLLNDDQTRRAMLRQIKARYPQMWRDVEEES